MEAVWGILYAVIIVYICLKDCFESRTSAEVSNMSFGGPLVACSQLKFSHVCVLIDPTHNLRVCAVFFFLIACVVLAMSRRVPIGGFQDVVADKKEALHCFR